jgi:predicted DNA-binding ArsR family transcriptional regulator
MRRISCMCWYGLYLTDGSCNVMSSMSTLALEQATKMDHMNEEIKNLAKKIDSIMDKLNNSFHAVHRHLQSQDESLERAVVHRTALYDSNKISVDKILNHMTHQTDESLSGGLGKRGFRGKYDVEV